MGYQVTARKWRPQTFDDIVEQGHVTRTLKNAIRLGRVAHAYLFAGTRGVGKTTTARVLAKALNCEQGLSADPCNECQTCLEITQGSSLDIVEIDGASNRGIDEIRDLREHLRYLPSRNRYKVYIIDEVHMLTKEAFNALLKTLEEPPSHVVFIFATTELEKIPYTILSRCQRFEFKSVSLSGMVAQLEHITHSEGITITPTSLRRIAQAAEGSMRDAQSLLDQVVAYCGVEVQDADVSQLLGSVEGERLAQCLQALFRQDAATALQIVNQLQAEGHEAIGIARALLAWLRHVVVLKTTDRPGDLITLSETDLAALRPVVSLATVEEIYGHFQTLTMAEGTLRTASNPFIVLEMALVRMACIGRVQPLQRILEHLQDLEAGQPITSSPSSPHLSAVAHEPASNEPASAVQLPPATGSPTLDEPSGAPPAAAEGDFWEALYERVAAQRPSLAAFLQAGRVLERTENKLIIGFAKQDSFSRTSLLEPENFTLVRTAVATVVGRPLPVEIVALEDHASGSNGTGGEETETPDERTIEEMQRKKKETIQAVLDIFDGRIVT